MTNRPLTIDGILDLAGFQIFPAEANKNKQQAKQALASLIEQYLAEVIKVPPCNCKHARQIIQEQRTKATAIVEGLRK